LLCGQLSGQRATRKIFLGKKFAFLSKSRPNFPSPVSGARIRTTMNATRRARPQPAVNHRRTVIDFLPF
jgi:hypothetical protein